jgi:hypothetical protein
VLKVNLRLNDPFYLTRSIRPAFNSFYPAPGDLRPRSLLLSRVDPTVGRRQYRQSARCLRAPFDLTIPNQQLAVTATPDRHTHEHVLAVESLHHLHAFHRQLSFPALGRADRKNRRPRGQIESGPIPLDAMGFANVGLLTFPEGNATGHPLAPGSPHFHVLEVQPARSVALNPHFRGRPGAHRELPGRRRMRGRRLDLGLARYGYGDFSVVYPHRQVRHQRALDVSDHLLGRKFRGRQNMYLFHRSTFTLYYFRGDNPWQRED